MPIRIACTLGQRGIGGALATWARDATIAGSTDARRVGGAYKQEMALPRWALRAAPAAVLATTVAVVAAPAGPADAAQILSQGQAHTTTVASCTPGFAPLLPGVWGPIPALLPSPGINAWAEHYTNPHAGFPGVGQQYRMRVVFGAPGDPCQTQAVKVSAALGPNTTVTGPITCQYFQISNDAPVSYSNCQNALPTSAGTAPYTLRINDPLGGSRGGAWLVPNGQLIVIEIPVTTSVAGSREYGFDLRIADGMSAQGSWIQVKHSAIVYGTHAGGGSTPPPGGGGPPAGNPYCHPTTGATRYGPGRIGYPSSPPTLGFHTPGVSALRSDGGVLWSFLEPQGTTGKIQMQLRLTGDSVPANWDTVEMCFDDSALPSYRIFADASGALAPNTSYQWRVRYFPEYHNGSTWVGGTMIDTAWSEPFLTLPASTAVVGASDPFRPEVQVPCTAEELTEYLLDPTVLTITFECPRDPATGMTKPVTLQLTQEHVIDRSLTIEGGGLVTLQAASNKRLFEVREQNVVFDGLGLTGGSSSTDGGAVLINQNGTLTVRDSIVHGNRAMYHGGAFRVLEGSGPGRGQLTIINSTVSANHAGHGNAATGAGGAVSNSGNLTIVASEISGNTARNVGGALAAGPGSQTRTYLATFSRNRVLTTGGAVTGVGGAAAVSGFVEMRNTTFSENEAELAGALKLNPTARILVASGQSIGLANLTVVGNRTTGASGALAVDPPTGGGGAPIQIRNSVIAGNAGKNCASALTGLVQHGGNVEDAAHCGFNQPTDRTNANVPFSHLGSWGQAGGGYTRLISTLVPLHGSAAIGAATACGAPAGFPADRDANYRPQPASGRCDAGAVQVVADDAAPAATEITRRAASPTTASQVSWTVEFSEGVVGADAGDFALTATGRSAAQIVSVTPIGQLIEQASPDATPTVHEVELPAGTLAARYRVDATAGTGDGGSLTLDLKPGASIWDASNMQTTAGLTGPAYAFSPSGGPGGPGAPGGPVGMIGPSGRVCMGVSGDPGDVALVNLTPVLAAGPGNGQLLSSDVTEPPNASNVNYAPGTVDPNVAAAPIGTDGTVCYLNSRHTTVHLIADHLGTITSTAYTRADPTGAPKRLIDTRG